MLLTRAQREAVKRIYVRAINSDHPYTGSYADFRRTVQPAIGMDCVLVHWAGMWLGIETDGYTHS